MYLLWKKHITISFCTSKHEFLNPKKVTVSYIEFTNSKLYVLTLFFHFRTDRFFKGVHMYIFICAFTLPFFLIMVT